LVSAVCNAGGLGTIASVGLGEFEKDIYANYARANARALKKEIEKTRAMTDKPFAVNIMSILTDYEELVKTCNELRVAVIVSGAGLPLKLPKYVTNSYTKLVPVISSARAAAIVFRTWEKKFQRVPDAVVVEGPKSGGHQGFSWDELLELDKYSLKTILKDVGEIVKLYKVRYKKEIPIIAAGGLYSDKDIALYLNNGAQAVQLGSRFVCTEECDVGQPFKDAYIRATEKDITLIDSPVGLPARVIKNGFYWRLQRKEKVSFNCEYQCLRTCNISEVPFCIARALLEAQRGDMERGLVLCSSTTHRVKKIRPVASLIDELFDGIEHTKTYTE
jgi:NAD(P)H-dependent flavin oxidoreductase YrpB (nitropropane dioxygenase family)